MTLVFSIKMKKQVKSLIKRIFVIFLLSYKICFCNKVFTTTNNVIIDKKYDSVNLNSKIGNINVISFCDSCNGWIFSDVELNDSGIKNITDEAGKLKIKLDNCTLSIEIDTFGKFKAIMFDTKPKLSSFEFLLEQFIYEINNKYKDEIILPCNKTTKFKTRFLKIPFEFKLTDF